MSSPFQTIHSSIRFACPWYKVRQSDIILPDGTVGQYNVVDVPPCAFVVPVTAEGYMLLIKQYRYPHNSWVWEIPAGAIHAGETMLASAQTELREEVGGESDDWHYLGEYKTANGRSNEVAHLYLALNVTIRHETAHESAEVLTVHPTPIPDVIQMIQNNELRDAPSALAIMLALPHLQTTF